MRGLQNANLAFQIAESFAIPNRVKIPPFRWSTQHSLRLQTACLHCENRFSRGRPKGYACFQSRQRYYHRPPCHFSHSPHTPQAADERSFATAVEDSSSTLKETHAQPLESADASVFPQTPKEVAASPGIAFQAHSVPATSNELDTKQDEDWFEEPEEECKQPNAGYYQSLGENWHMECTEIKHKPAKLLSRSVWWRKNFNILQTKYFWTRDDAQAISQPNETEDPYSIQSIEWRSIWFDQTEKDQPADSIANVASARDQIQGGSSTKSGFWDPLQIKYELDMRAYEDKMKLLDIGDDEEHLVRDLHWLNDDPQAIRTTWELQDQKSSHRLWERAMIWLLRYHPDKAVHVLWSTFTYPYPNIFAVLDTVKYLSAFYFMHHPKYTIVEVPTFVAFFLRFLHHLPQNFVATNPFQRTVHLILTHSNKNLGLTLYYALRQKNIRLHLWTNLHFAYFFAREGLFKLAMETLEEVISQGLDINSFPFLSTCNKIIRSSLLHPEGYHSSSHLVSRLMNIGVQFDQILYNVLLSNAVEAEDLQTATQIFELIERSNMGPDNFTWSIILIGCKKCQDPVITDRIMSKASSASLNYWAATNLIHCTYLHSKHRNVENIYNTISKVYLKYFDPSPLQELGISLESSSPESAQSLLKPPSAAIGIMLALFLKHHGTERNVMEIYNRFRSGILNGSSLVQLTLTDYTYNAFLYKASRWPTTLRFCTDILRDMTTALPDNVLPKHPETNEILAPAQPTLQTWNILLQAFVLHDKPAAAEKVLDLMQQRGLKPSIVTWNSIVNAYAQSQNVEGLMNAMMRMEKSGFGFDKHTRRGLKRFRNREELVKLLNKEKGNGSEELIGKIPIAEYQQSQSMTKGANSFVGEMNHHPFGNNHEPHENDESEVLNTMYRYYMARGFELPFPTHSSMA